MTPQELAALFRAIVSPHVAGLYDEDSMGYRDANLCANSMTLADTPRYLEYRAYPQYDPVAFGPFRWYARRVLRALNGRGFEVLGSGHYSIAFTHRASPGLVLKWCLTPDDSYITWAQYCRHHAGESVHYPTIHLIERLADGHIVVLPEYHEHKTCAAVRWVTRIEHELRENYDGDLRELSEFYTHFTPRGVPVSLVDAVLTVLEYFDGVATLDLHVGNLMLDDAGNIVIIDPVSESL